MSNVNYSNNTQHRVQKFPPHTLRWSSWNIQGSERVMGFLGNIQYIIQITAQLACFLISFTKNMEMTLCYKCFKEPWWFYIFVERFRDFNSRLELEIPLKLISDLQICWWFKCSCLKKMIFLHFTLIGFGLTKLANG